MDTETEVNNDKQSDPEPVRRAGVDPPAGCPPSALNCLVAGFAGYDLYLLWMLAGQEFEHERRKLVRIGASIVIPAFMGLFTTFWFLAPYVASVGTRILGSLAASLVILAVDSIIVTTVAKGSVFGTVVRILLSVCIGIMLAEPIVLTMYSKTIDAHLVAKLSGERVAQETADRADLARHDQLLAELNSKMARDQEELEAYSPRNIGLKHLREQAVREEEVVKQAQVNRSGVLEGVYAEKAGFLKQRQDITTEIQHKLLEMQQEESGQRDSRKTGHGTIYAQLEDDLRALKNDLRNVDEKLFRLNRTIDSTLADRSAGQSVQSQLRLESGPGEDSQVATLSAEESSERDRLRVETAGYRSSIAAVERQKRIAEEDIDALPGRYSLAARNDSLAQTEALYEVISERPVLAIKVITLFLLMFLTDIMPLIVKLTVRTSYDDHQQVLARKREMENAVSQQAFEADQIEKARKRVQRVSELCAAATTELRQFDAQSTDSRFVRSIQAKCGDAIEVAVSDALVKNGQPSRNRAHWGDLFASALKGIGMLFRVHSSP